MVKSDLSRQTQNDGPRGKWILPLKNTIHQTEEKKGRFLFVCIRVSCWVFRIENKLRTWNSIRAMTFESLMLFDTSRNCTRHIGLM